jgi:hypothetical protein
MRQCDGCTLCCTLLPIKEIGKKAGVRCRYQVAAGCGVYRRRDLMPYSCRLWNCRWLVEDDTADLLRPDVSHLVIDMIPDFVAVTDNETGEQKAVEVVQVWCDPAYRDAHREPQFRAYVERRAAEGKATIVRFSSADAVTLFAPPLSKDGEWFEIVGNIETEEAHRKRGARLAREHSKKMAPPERG